MNSGRLIYFRKFDLVIALYVLLAVIVAYSYKLRFSPAYFFNYEIDLQYLTVVLLNLYVFLIASAFWSRWKGEDVVLCGPNWRGRMRRDYLTSQHVIDFLRTVIFLKLVLITYGCLKQAIPLINPNLYDQELLGFDITLHAGLNPMTLLTSIFDTPFWGQFFDRTYFAWYYLKASVVAVFVIVKSRELHHWFFRSFYALWILGGLMAIILPSLGPVYLYPEWFHLSDTPIAYSLQQQLLEHYTALRTGPAQPSVFSYEGIAAFPSLHVGIAALTAFFCFRLSKWIGVIAVIYAVFVQAGSVYLGWHYALDGYYTALLAWALMRVTKQHGNRSNA